MKKYKNILIALLIINSFIFMAAEFPQWDVPAEAASLENPVPSNKKAIEEGSAIFKTQCSACHGAEGKGDGAIASADLTSEEFQAQTDGAIFHKITTGRGIMPAFKALATTDVWNITHYLRSFGNKVSDEAKRQVKVTLIVNNDNKNIEAVATETINGNEVAATDVKIGLYAKRYFGLLPLACSSSYSDSNGKITAIFPDDLPGDNEGNVVIIAKVEDSECNVFEETKTVQWGVAGDQEWTEIWKSERALWRTNNMLPFWVYILYLGITIGIWIGIIYVALQIKKIKSLSN